MSSIRPPRRLRSGWGRRLDLTVDPKSAKEKTAIDAAVAAERRRISRELHDRALQLLSGARLRAEACRRQLEESQPVSVEELHTIEASIDKAITEMRNLLAENQNADDLKAGSLERRLKDELEIFRARTGFKIDFRCAIGAHKLPLAVERELYFTLREGVLNAVRHARSSELHLSLSQNDNACEAKLSDNGIGFDTSSVDGSNHYGLKGMRERIENLGGTFTVRTAPGKGTQIEITVPFEHAEAAG